MPKTGDMFLNLIFFLSLLSPILPATVVFAKKNHRLEVLNFLMILCLLNFLKSLLLFFLPMSPDNQDLLSNIFLLVEFVIMVLMYRPAMPDWVGKYLHFFLIAFLSVVITLFLIQGMKNEMHILEILESAVLLFLCLTYLAGLVYGDSLHIFALPLCWMSIGSLFYFSILILMTLFGKDPVAIDGKETYSVAILLSVANLIRFLFFLLAALFSE